MQMDLPYFVFAQCDRVAPLTRAQLPEMLALCQSNPLYYLHYGTSPSLERLAQDLTALPPGVSGQAKHFFGLWQGAQLIGLVDLILGYPTEETAYLGWFILDAAVQGRGLGSALIDQLCRQLAGRGFAKLRLAYMETNPQSAHFWRKNGFSPAGDPVTLEGGRVAVPMERPLVGSR